MARRTWRIHAASGFGGCFLVIGTLGSVLAPAGELHRPPALYSAFIVFASCYILALLASRGASAGRLVVGAGILSVAIFTLSAAAIYFWRIWLDVVHALAATWLLVPLLLGLRWKLARASISAPKE